MDFNLLYNSMVNEISTVASGIAAAENRPVTNDDTRQAINNILDAGMTYSGSGQQGIFIIASIETSLKAMEVGIDGDYSVYASVEECVKLMEAVGVKSREITGFTESVELILNNLPYDLQILDKGIVEMGNFTLLSTLIEDDMIPDNETLNVILDKGIVLSRINGVVYISSVDTFLVTLETIGLAQVVA